MTMAAQVRGGFYDFLSAVQFLTRVPLSSLPYDAGSLSRSAKFFPVVGLLLGSLAAGWMLLLEAHLPRLVAAVLTIGLLVTITGCFHEDGLADAADGFGGGHTRVKVLTIMKDSRIGSYGAMALGLSLMARVSLLAALSAHEAVRYLIAAHVLCRWTTLPLSFFLPSASEGGQGARVAGMTTRGSLIVGTIFSFAIALLLLRMRGMAAIASAVLLTLATGFYYKRRIGGVTGDCFGATNQLTESLVYLCGVWMV